MAKLKEDSWLLSGGFLKRSFSIWFHSFVANLIISIILAILILTLIYIFLGDEIMEFIQNADLLLDDASKISNILNKVIKNLDQLDELSKYLP